MADQNMKVAVASSDGIVVNQHFGHASRFYIYDAADEPKCLEVRHVTPACDQGSHNDEHLRKNLLTIADCDYLLVSRIGDGAAGAALQVGIEPYEIPGMITESLEQLIKFIKIKELFRQRGI